MASLQSSNACDCQRAAQGGLDVQPLPRTQSAPGADLQRALDRLLQGVVRGALIGFTLRGGLHAVGAVLAAASKRKGRSVTARGAIDDTLRFTAFLGALAGIYIGVDEGIAAAVGKETSAKWRSLVAGICAGPALLLTGPKNRHYSLATYILLRGITLLIRAGNKPRCKQRHPWLHAALAPTRMEHGDTLLMCGACSQIIYAFIMMPQTLPQSYVRFIRKQGAKELYVWQGVRELAERTAAGRPIGPLISLMGTPHQHSKAAVPCHFFHPGQTCLQHPLQLIVPAYKRALSVYLPVYVLPALLVHREQVLKKPVPILQKVLLGIARSSLFLSSFICVAFGGACAGHNITGRSTGTIIACSTWIGGLATLVEKKSRRMELALYVLSRALESFCTCCTEWGWLSPRHLPPRLDILLFAAGVGAITHCYSGYNGMHRDVFRSKYLNILDFVFGSTGFTEGKIKHLPSNHDLLKSMSIKVRSFSYSNLQGARSRGHSQSYSSLETVAERAAGMAAAAAADAAAAAAGGVCVDSSASCLPPVASPTAGATVQGNSSSSSGSSKRRSTSWPDASLSSAPTAAAAAAVAAAAAAAGERAILQSAAVAAAEGQQILAGGSTAACTAAAAAVQQTADSSTDITVVEAEVLQLTEA